jgi:hypothetical protein
MTIAQDEPIDAVRWFAHVALMTPQDRRTAMTDSIDRKKRAWHRLFARREPAPWESRKSAELLRDVSLDAWACQKIAELLDIQCDPGESAADFVSQMLREPYVEHVRIQAEKDVLRAQRGVQDQ